MSAPCSRLADSTLPFCSSVSVASASHLDAGFYTCKLAEDDEAVAVAGEVDLRDLYDSDAPANDLEKIYVYVDGTVH